MKYNNVRFIKTKNFFEGSKQINGKEIKAYSPKSALQCAQILNYNCQKANFPLPNPDLDCKPPPPKIHAIKQSKYNRVNWDKSHNCYIGKVRRNGKRIQCSDKNEIKCVSVLNFLCSEAKIPEPNPSVGRKRPSKKKAVKKSKFNNIYWVDSENRFQGLKRFKKKAIRCSATSELRAAQLLNFLCKKAKVPLPNPELGSNKPAAKRPPRKRKKMKKRSKRKKAKARRSKTISVKKERLEEYEAYKDCFYFRDLDERNSYLPLFSIPSSFPNEELKDLKRTYVEPRPRVLTKEMRSIRGRSRTRKTNKILPAIISEYPTFFKKFKLVASKEKRLVWLRILNHWMVHGTRKDWIKPWSPVKEIAFDGVDQGYTNTREKAIDLTRNMNVKSECEDYSNTIFDPVEII